MMIDWDNTPEGATHWNCENDMYYKSVDGVVYCHNGEPHDTWDESDFKTDELVDVRIFTPRPIEPTPYTRDEALQFLVDNLDEWPTVIDDAPLCAGWGWVVNTVGGTALMRIGRSCGSIGKYHWLKIQGLSDPQQQDPATAEQGVKYDTGKPIIGAIPPHAELAVARVMTFGAQKYARDNWRKIDDIPTRYMDAALRHLNAIRRGETVDPESGEHHLAHAACCIMFMLDVEEQSGNDNP